MLPPLDPDLTLGVPTDLLKVAPELILGVLICLCTDERAGRSFEGVDRRGVTIGELLRIEGVEEERSITLLPTERSMETLLLS